MQTTRWLVGVPFFGVRYYSTEAIDSAEARERGGEGLRTFEYEDEEGSGDIRTYTTEPLGSREIKPDA